MLLACYIRRYFKISIICLSLAGLLPEVHGAKRVFATVDPNASAINSAVETYDPASGTFTSLASSSVTTREAHSAILLKNGQVFIAGGYNGAYLSSSGNFNPTTGIFTGTGLMSNARSGHAAVLLNTGKVLVAGGFNGSTYLATAELYDPSTGTFSSAGVTLAAGAQGLTATLLSDGKVLLAGGYGGIFLNAAEVYDPGADTLKATSGLMNVARTGHTATLLSDGKVLIVGGQNSDGYVNSAELYDPSTGKFTTASGTMTAQRHGHTATLLSSGKVLITGGFNGSYLSSAELYDPATGKFAATSGAMTAARNGQAAVLLSTGKVLISGGYNGSYLKSAELFDPSAGNFSAVPGSMAVARDFHATTVLANGKVLITGGQSSDLLTFDVNSSGGDNISPNIALSSDSKTGYVPYTGSGVVVAFSMQTGAELKRITTGGYPALLTPLKDGKTLAVVSVLDNKIFLIDTQALQLKATYTFANAQFGFGSNLVLSPDGTLGYVSSSGTGQVIKFTMATGQESARLTGMLTPTQLTLSLDGSILMAVDVSAVELAIADSSSMTRKATMKPRERWATASLTLFNRAVLSADGSSAVLATQDVTGSLRQGTAMVFKPSTGEILASPLIGSLAGYTGLTPDGKDWVVLCETSISIIATANPANVQDISTAQGDPLGSANIVFSPDSKYAFYVSSTTDLFFQHDLITTGVVGQVLIGDNPDRGHDQPSSVAITADGHTLAVLEFIGNRIDLLTDTTILTSTKFLLSGDQFTGLSLVNLSNTPTKFTVTALDNFGQAITADSLTNPIVLNLGPNAQISQNVSQLFAFDLTKEQAGRLQVEADQPKVAGYTTIGQIRATWLGYYLNSLDGVPLLQDVSSDFIVPEIGRDNGEAVLLDIVNPNFAAQSYDLLRYGQDGTLIGKKTAQSAPLTNRLEQVFTDQFPATEAAKVLFTGGQVSGAPSITAETYDLTTTTFARTGALTVARQGHGSTLLLDGRVLVTGGRNNTDGVLSSAETYAISGSTFTTAAAMTASRYRHSSTLLPSGRVLLAGGQNAGGVNKTAETFDPSTSTFTTAAGAMTVPRDAHTATLLPSGKVLLTGGNDGTVVSRTAELFDPATGVFTTTGSMTTGRVFHTATALSHGRVLISGGFNTAYLSTAEVYDPVSGTFTATKGSMNTARGSHTATLLSGGTVLITGGTSGTVLSSAEIYDPATDSFKLAAGTMTSARSLHTATLTGDDKVVLIGGTDGTNDLDTAETYTPSTQTFQPTSGILISARSAHAATLLQSGSEGYLRGQCKQGLMFTEFYGAARDGGAVNGIDVTKFAGAYRLYAPQFATTSGFRTILNLVNANLNGDAKVVITLHAADGKVLGTPVLRILPQSAQLKEDVVNIFGSDPAVLNTNGWIEISATLDKVVGTVTYTNTDGTIVTALELSGSPLTRFVLPAVAEDSTYQTGVALLNASAQQATVTVELWGPNGTLDRTATIKIPAGARVAQYLSDYFPNLTPHLVANVRISSDVPIYASGLMNDRALNFLAAIPALSIPGN